MWEHDYYWKTVKDNIYNIDVNPKIRYRKIKKTNSLTGENYIYFHFEIFKPPYFFGLLGNKWEEAIQSYDYNTGKAFCEYLLMKK